MQHAALPAAHVSASAEVKALIGNLLKLVDDSALPALTKDKIHDATYCLETITLAHVVPESGIDFQIFGMSAGEARVASQLHKNIGRTVTREKIYDNLYAAKIDGGPQEKIIQVMVCKVRRKIATCNARFSIATVWGVGYRMDSINAD